MKTSTGLTSLLAAGAACAKPFYNRRTTNTTLPTTVIAGVEVVDTQIVRDAQALIQPLTPYLYSHQMRSWLYGAARMNANQTLKDTIDLEAHAVGTMLHDLGWDMRPDSPWTTLDRKFEIDGAIGAREFILNHPDAPNWDENRLRTVFNAIALHTSTGIVEFMEPEIDNIVSSIGLDYRGYEGSVITQEVYRGIVDAFPNNELFSGTNETFIFFCQLKPQVTYDSSMQPYGEAYVPGYSAVGFRSFDLIHSGVPPY